MAQEREDYVTCFVAVVQHMGPSKLHHARALLTKGGLVRALSKVLAGTLPASDKDKDSEEWQRWRGGKSHDGYPGMIYNRGCM